MFIQAFLCGPFDTNAYLIACLNTHQAAIIDPAPESYQVLVDYLDSHSLIPQKILLTHSHWDHIADTAPLKKHYGLPVFVHPLDAPNLQHPGADRLPCWLTIEGVEPDGKLEEKDIVPIGELIFEVIHTPGHTPGSICLYCQKEAVLIAGDTLFRHSIGNLSFPTSRPEQMWPSLDKLAKLPADTKVYPGHGGSTTIGAEKWLPRAREIFGKP
jgi:hydroxyacylglutathione hydrolase